MWELSSQLSEIDVMLLMFGVGLHFSLDDLLAARKITPGANTCPNPATTSPLVAFQKVWGWSFRGRIGFPELLFPLQAQVLLKALRV